MSAVVLNIRKHAFCFMYSVIFCTQSSLLPPCTYAFLKCCNLLLKTCFFLPLFTRVCRVKFLFLLKQFIDMKIKAKVTRRNVHSYIQIVKRKVKKRNKYFELSHSCSLSRVFSFMSKKWRVGNLTAPRSSHGATLTTHKIKKKQKLFY